LPQFPEIWLLETFVPELFTSVGYFFAKAMIKRSFTSLQTHIFLKLISKFSYTGSRPFVAVCSAF